MEEVCPSSPAPNSTMSKVGKPRRKGTVLETKSRITFRLLRWTTAITMNGVYIFIGHAYLLQQQTQHSTVITVRVADGYATFVHPDKSASALQGVSFSELMLPTMSNIREGVVASTESKVKNPLRLPVHHNRLYTG